MDWTFFSGALFGFLFSLCVMVLLWFLTGLLDKASKDSFDGRDSDGRLLISIDKTMALYTVRTLEFDNRPVVVEFVKLLRRAIGVSGDRAKIER